MTYGFFVEEGGVDFHQKAHEILHKLFTMRLNPIVMFGNQEEELKRKEKTDYKSEINA